MNHLYQIEVGLPATYRQQLICAGAIKPVNQEEVMWIINNHKLYSIPGHIVMYLKTLINDVESAL